MNKKSRILTVMVCLVMVATVFWVAAPANVSASVSTRTYTLDADFDEGILAGVEHETVHDQLQLSEEVTTLPFIWVPNSNEGTVSKVDTVTGDELGRYRTGPPSPTASGNPSRTTVDLQGNVWFGNRRTGTAVKIGLNESGQCIDRNANGKIDTSQDNNTDGDITGTEILAWGNDECVLYEVVLVPGSEGTYIPGQNIGPYTNNDWYVSPRGFAIDANNSVWVGTWATQKYYYINETGVILKTVDVASWGHNAYGAVIDASGILWSSGQTYDHLLRLDPSIDPPTISKLNMGHFVYGIGLDYLGHLFASGWEYCKLSRVNVTTSTIDWTKTRTSLCYARGVAVTSDNHVWVASSSRGTVSRYRNDGTFVTEISVGITPTGTAVDAAGKVWVTNYGDEYIKRINATSNSVDLSKRIIGGNHYSYSDMTGIVLWTITTRKGYWTVVFDSGVADTSWGTISWTSSEPAGTSITVKVKSSNDMSTWSSLETAANGVPLSSTPDGRYLEINATLFSSVKDVSPILYDLTVKTANQPPVADANGPYTANENEVITFDGSGSYDPDGHALEYRWDFLNNGTWTAWSDSPYANFTYGDDFVGTAVLEVREKTPDQYTDTDTADVTVNNVCPFADITSVYIEATFTLRVAGEKWHNVGLEIFEDGTSIAYIEVERYPGDPLLNPVRSGPGNSIAIQIDPVKTYTAMVYFDARADVWNPISGQINGANPTWVIVDVENSPPEKYFHNFVVKKGGVVRPVQTWDVGDITGMLHTKEFTFIGVATDSGSDDLTFEWDFNNDGIPDRTVTYLRVQLQPEPPAPPIYTPDVNPMSATDVGKFTYATSGTYTVTLKVTDDDNCTTTVQTIITV